MSDGTIKSRDEAYRMAAKLIQSKIDPFYDYDLAKKIDTLLVYAMTGNVPASYAENNTRSEVLDWINGRPSSLDNLRGGV